jgi:hypothetical protein
MNKRTPTLEELRLVAVRSQGLVKSFDTCDVQGGRILLDGQTFLLAMMGLHEALCRLKIYDDGRLGSVIGWPYDLPGAVRGIVINLRSMASDLGSDQLFRDDGSAGGIIATEGVHIIRDGKRSTDEISFVDKTISVEMVERHVDRIRKAANLLTQWIQEAAEDYAHSSNQDTKPKAWFGEQKATTEPGDLGAPASPDEQPAGYLGIVVDEAERTVQRKGFQSVVSFDGKRVLWPTFSLLLKKRGKVVPDDALRSDVHYGTIEVGTISRSVSRVNKLIKPLGIQAKRVEGTGYRLVNK